MKNGLQSGDAAMDIAYANTGSAIKSGDVVAFGGRFGIANTDIAATTGVGTLKMEGMYRLKKNTGYTLAQGQRVTWDGTYVQAWTPASTTKCMGIMGKAAATGDTTADVILGAFPARVFSVAHTVTSGEDSANAAAIDTGFGADPSNFVVQIESTGHVMRAPQGACTFGTTTNLGKITVNDSGLAVSEIVHLIAYE